MDLKYITLISILFFMPLVAADTDQGKHARDEIRILSVEQEADTFRNRGIYNYEEVFLEHLKSAQANNLSSNIKVGDTNLLGVNFASIEKENFLKQQTKEQQEAEEASMEKYPEFLEGYCSTPVELQVQKIASYAYLDCNFDHLGDATLAVSLVPDFYSMALIGRPLYVSYLSEDGKKKRIVVESGVTLRQDKNSINIADVANDYKIEKLLATGAYRTLDVATQNAKLYMQDVRASKMSEEQTHLNSGIGGTTIIETKNYEAPQMSQYIIAAGIEMVSEFSRLLGEAVVQNLPYTFMVYKDSIMYADLKLSTSPGLKGLDFKNDEIIKTQPKPSLANPFPQDVSHEDIRIMQQTGSGSAATDSRPRIRQ
jgi:hypothetical protein